MGNRRNVTIGRNVVRAAADHFQGRKVKCQGRQAVTEKEAYLRNGKAYELQNGIQTEYTMTGVTDMTAHP